MIYTFDQFRIDTDRFEISGAAGPIEAEPQTLDFLIYLVRHRNELVSKDQIHEAFWPGRIVSEAALSTLVRNARRLIGDSGNEQKFIETRHGRGFRFCAEVSACNPAGPDSSAVPRVLGAPTIAVLPFEQLSGEPLDRRLAESMTEEVSTGLSRFRWFSVVARNLVGAYCNKPVEKRDVQGDLGADYIIEGSLLREAGTVRVHAKLINTSAANQIWAERWDLKFDNVLALLDSATQLVVGAVQPELIEAERKRAEQTEPEARNAWQLFALAQQLLASPDKQSNTRARLLLEQARAMEPDSARVLAGIALTHFWDHKFAWSASAELSLGSAAHAASRAVQLANDDSWAWTALGVCKLILGDHEGALADCRRAIDADANSAMAHGGLSWCLAYDGQYEEALDAFQKANELSPRDRRQVFWLTGKAIAEFALERFEAALKTAQLMVQESPDHPAAHRMVAASAARLGMSPTAQAAADRLRQLLPRHDVDTVVEQMPFKHRHDRDRYRNALRLAGLAGSSEKTEPLQPTATTNEDAASPAQQVKNCVTFDGVRIAYATTGSGPPLLKVANWSNHLELDFVNPIWGPVARELSRYRSLIRYDERGMGLSARDVADFGFEQVIGSLEAVVAAAGLSSFPIIGFSQGGALAIEYAARYPEQVNALVLIGAYARGWRHSSWGAATERIGAVATLARLGIEEDVPVYRRLLSQLVIPNASPEEQRDLDRFLLHSVPARSAANILETIGGFDVSARLAEIKIPVLIMHSERDLSVDISHGRELAAEIPGSRFVSLDSGSHLVSGSDPAWSVMCHEIEAFLTKN